MSRSLSLTYRTAIDAEHDGTVVDILLVTITHPSLATPIRLSSDPTQRLSVGADVVYGTISRGNEYIYLPFRYVPPEDGDEGPPVLRLTIANFSTELMNVIRSITTTALVTAELVGSTTPDTVEITFPDFDFVHFSYDDNTIEVSLAIDSLVNIPVPAGSFTPNYFGGLF